MVTPVERQIETPNGPGRMLAYRAERPLSTLLLTHGAGNGIETHDLAALARLLPRQRVSVYLFEQAWKVAGRAIATPPATLDAGLLAAVGDSKIRTRLILGGRSAGARAAVRVGREVGASGCVALAFPLHPPGRPEKSRLAELTGSRLPTLVIQGERDPMGRPEEFPADTQIAVVPQGDHSLRVPAKTGLGQPDLDEYLSDAVVQWLVATFGPESVQLRRPRRHGNRTTR